MDIEISDALSRTSQERISDSIAEVKGYARSIGESANLPDIIRTGDATKPTDNNLLSALRIYRDLMRKDKDDRTPYGLSVGGRLTAEDILSSREFIAGLMGWQIDQRGNAEFESGVFRSFAQFAEIITNRLSAIEGDTLLTEADTIEDVTDHGDNTYTLRLHPKWEGYFTAQIENNVLKGIYNNITGSLTPGAGQQTMNNAVYYTCWMRVLTVNAAANTVDVVLYPDDETPAGRNFAPQPMMKVARWGNSGSADDPRYARRQECLYLSSTEGRIMKLFHVTKPIIDAGNVAASFGTVPDFLCALDPRIEPGAQGVYVKDLIAQNFIKTNYQGRPDPTLRFRGAFDPTADYYGGDTLREETQDYEQSIAEHCGCQWLCSRTGTHKAPSWRETDWTFYLGDPSFRVYFTGGPPAVPPRSFKFTLTLHAEKYNQDVTGDILPQDVVWTRYTEDSNGDQRLASDTIWATRRGNSGMSIELTEADIDIGSLGVPKVAVFTATVTLRDGEETTASLQF